MNTNSKQSADKTHSGAVCRIIGVLFGLFAFIWLPTLEVDAAFRLISPPDGNDFVEPVTVFRWTRSDNPAVHSYRLIIAEDPNLDPIDLDLPKPGDSIIAPQVAVSLKDDLAFFEGVTLHWRVIGLDQAGDPVEESQEVFSFLFFTDQRGFTIISGLVKSDLNQLGLVGARVAVSSARHAGTTNNIVETEFNGEYIAIAVTTDNDQVPIPFPIEITSTKQGFEPITVILQESEKVNGVITRNLTMMSDGDGDGDGDGISDAAENDSTCLDADDADTDDDGIADGDEDTNKNGVKNPGESDPCRRDTDNDRIQDGTELGLIIDDIGPDTDTAIFQPDLDSSTKTDPLNDDSDNDGLLDGEEDLNHNGQVDAGETNPSFLNDFPFSSSLQLRSPPNCKTPNNLNLCDATEKVTVFQWTRSDNPAVHSYRLIIADDPNMENIVLNLPKPGDSIIAPQAAVNLEDDLEQQFQGDFAGKALYWRVIGLNMAVDPVEQSQNVFLFIFFTDQRGLTVISGLVKSDLNQLGLVGASVAVSSVQHADTTNSIKETEFNGEYIIIAVTRDGDKLIGPPIGPPIEITYTKEGFKPTTKPVNQTGVVKVAPLLMESLADSDGDGIRDAVENGLACLDADDSDTDDDGILDGNEDTDHDGAMDAFETDPCEADTDNDGLLDGTEIGLTAPQGSDTDLNMFVPDADPTTTTDPLDEDSDDDGRLDGEEDLNHNGQMDTGETDPNPFSAGALPAILSLLLGD